MLNFVKKNFFYIAIVLVILEILSCIINNIGFGCVYGFLISLFFASLIFFLGCKVFNKGYISDKGIFVLLGIGVISIIFCIISFIKRDGGYSFLSLSASTFFITEFFYIKIFDIKEN